MGLGTVEGASTSHNRGMLVGVLAPLRPEQSVGRAHPHQRPSPGTHCSSQGGRGREENSGQAQLEPKWASHSRHIKHPLSTTGRTICGYLKLSHASKLRQLAGKQLADAHGQLEVDQQAVMRMSETRDACFHDSSCETTFTLSSSSF